MSLFSSHHVNRTRSQLGGLLAVVALLYVAAGIGMAYVAGFDAVRERLDQAHWWWLAATAAAVAVAFCGYYFAYCGIEAVEQGPEFDRPALLAVVASGFGGFLARGGTALDEVAMRAAGADGRESKVRVIALAGFEHGALALIVCPAAIIALVTGAVIPRTDFTWPWAVVPPPAFALAIWLALRYRDRLRGRRGWRGRIGVFFDAIYLVYAILSRPSRRGIALLGMLVYWAGDMFALWSSTAAFGFQMSVLSVILAVGTGMLFTRRTAPLAGAGLMICALVPTLWYGAAVPFAAATLGVAAYRFFTLWVPLPAAFASLPKLRELTRTGEETSGRGTRVDRGEPALQQ